MRLTSDAVEDRAFARLDARLQRDADHPVALALSGGGDSIALLHIAAAWARSRNRKLLALTVDHGLNPASAEWTAFAGRAAQAAGADWRPLPWQGAKPLAGLSAAARTARHALITEAARAAGARVVLFAHTADDIAEADWMRAEGSTLGRVQEWSPSPAWPEGRGLMLLRPLLAERRDALRDYLRARSLVWLEDPANEDQRFARARARRSLQTNQGGGSQAPDLCGEDRLLPEEVWPSALRVRRDVSARALASALVCAGGGTTPPRGHRLARLIERLTQQQDFTAVLAGSRLAAAGDAVLIHREAGELRRRPLAPLSLAPGQPAVWDGRFEITAHEPGWSVVPAQGLLARLDAQDHRALAALPASLRPNLPVLIREDGSGPVLAGRAAQVRSLVSRRLNLFLGEVTQESGLAPPNDGGMTGTDLFLLDDGADAPDRVIRGL